MARLKAAQRRQQLIDVATHLFAAGGYEATTTSAIAQAAGVTEPILYRHFKSKQELFVAIVQAVSTQTLTQWRDLTKNLHDPEDQVRAISSALPDHMQRLTDAYHVLHGALAISRDKKVLAVIHEHYQQIETFFAAIVQRGQQSGSFRRDVSPSAAAWQFIFAGIGYAMIALNLGPQDKHKIDEIIETLVRGVKG